MPRLTTDHRSNRTRVPGTFRPGLASDRDRFEPFSNAGDWDRPEWRGADGHPDEAVRRAYEGGFLRAVEAGMSLADARDHAAQQATLVVAGRAS